MKFSQLVMLIFIVNILNVVFLFSIESQDISDFESQLEGWFIDDDSFVERVDTFSDEVLITSDKNNWLTQVTSDAIQGFTNALRLVTIGFQIVGLVLWGWLAPISYLQFVAAEATIIGFVGLLAVMYLSWFNIMLVIRLYKFIKGSDT